nr:uncharacterized protein LOC112994447 [Dromaius novaehollandiae]
MTNVCCVSSPAVEACYQVSKTYSLRRLERKTNKVGSMSSEGGEGWRKRTRFRPDIRTREAAWKTASSLPEDRNRMGREGYWCRHLRMLSRQWSSVVVVASVNIQRCRCC